MTKQSETVTVGAAGLSSSPIAIHLEGLDEAVDLSNAAAKLARVRGLLRSLQSVAVAYSGGVDSTLVLKLAVEELGDQAIGVTAVSPSLPAGELDEARALADSFGARFQVLETNEVDNPDYQANTEARCYFCKREVYGEIKEFARRQEIRYVADGLNLDDLTDRRPGRRAALEHGVRSPLAESELSKAEVRAISRQLGLPTWDEPSLACLSSRIPYGMPVTRQALGQIDLAEQVIRRLGIRQVRVRHHDGLARIEVEPGDIPTVLAHQGEIAHALRGLGYQFVTVDLEGYRMGSLNDLKR
jgi:pyridinium-3,5-biscarboxylic acid mononucleotide sulfurtransferase